jgi:hypothetical protein
MKKSNTKASQHKQKRASKNKLRLADKPHLSKQQRQESAERYRLTSQIRNNNILLAQRELESIAKEKLND